MHPGADSVKKRRVVFIDRDGTINVDVGYPALFDQIHIYPESFQAVKKLARAGFAVVVITHQSGVGRGYFTEEDLGILHRKMEAVFAENGGKIDGFYYCPHYPLSLDATYARDCTCKKPYPELALRAAGELDLSMENSYMIGDKADDVLMALGIGASPILVRSGYGMASLDFLRAQGIIPACIADGILDAADWILTQEDLSSGDRL